MELKELSPAQRRALGLLVDSPYLVNGWLSQNRGVHLGSARVLAQAGLAELEHGLWGTWRVRITYEGRACILRDTLSKLRVRKDVSL